MNTFTEARANFKPDLRGLAACTDEARIAALDNDPGSPDPDTFDALVGRMQTSKGQLPKRAILSPMVKWGNPASGPYTWPIDATRSFDLDVAVVNMPPSNARKGLVAWAALGHETCGHDILHADIGLQAEMAGNVRRALAGMPANLPNYWADRIDETSSDVMGILNTGPAGLL